MCNIFIDERNEPSPVCFHDSIINLVIMCVAFPGNVRQLFRIGGNNTHENFY